MKPNCTVTLAVGAALLAASPTPAAGVERPWYVEADLGRSSVDEVLDGSRLDESATAFRFATGYEFTPYVGVEGAYVGLGTLEADVAGSGRIEAESDGFEINVVGRWEVLPSFALLARLGNFWWNGETRSECCAEEESGNDVVVGLGVEYRLFDTIAFTGGWHRYRIDDVDVDLLSLGVRLRFGEIR